jgi:hypothetical protein
MPRYNGEPKWNENYFHEAQFPKQGITVFTDIIFSKSFFGKNSCKFSCIITFDNGERYDVIQDYSENEFYIQNKGFGIHFGDNFIELKQDNYIINLENKNVKLNLTYKISNPPHIFGDGIINFDNKSFLAFSQPVIGAFVNGRLEYKDKVINLSGRGSVEHDYNTINPINNPRKWRSFWLYNDRYSINIDTVILTNKTQIDRVVVTKDGNYLGSFLNCGLKTDNYVMDSCNNFKYPTTFSIDHSESDGNQIKANLKFRSFTDKFSAFKSLSPAIYKIVKNAVGDMWVYRFWADGEFTLKFDNGMEEVIHLSGIGNFVDSEKSTKDE